MHASCSWKVTTLAHIHRSFVVEGRHAKKRRRQGLTYSGIGISGFLML